MRGAASNAELRWPIDRNSAVGQAIRRAGQPGYLTWLDHVRSAAGCTRPIRLAGTLDTVSAGTGVRLRRVDTASMPDGVIYKACGNRRYAVCPSCAETYRRDAYQLVRAGLVGGKGIPDTVASHEAVFATFTAPSFGTVHTRVVRRHTCAGRRRCDCRPEPCHARRDTPGLCEHGTPQVCWVRHDACDRVLGQPLCVDCYDHDHHAVWNLYAGELWRRTKEATERHLARLAWRRGISPVLVQSASGNLREVPPVRVSHGKVAEFQTRGAVHFHALLRLDGVDPDDPDVIVPAPNGITGADLADAIQHVAKAVTFTTPAHPDNATGWRIGWGDQLDVRHIATTGTGEITDQAVAAYLAKYATKSTEATGHRSARLTLETVDSHADPDGDHTARIVDACWRLGRPTHTPVPLSARPCRPQPPTRLRSTWTCTGCGKTTRLAECPHCAEVTRPAPVDTYVSTPDATDNPYAGLRRWAHMLGFGGHFLTKARRYSVTFGHIRGLRTAYRHAEDHGPAVDPTIGAADLGDQKTTLVVGTLSYAGTGWRTVGDALLANTAADQARRRREVGREELDHEIGSTVAGTVPTAA